MSTIAWRAMEEASVSWEQSDLDAFDAKYLSLSRARELDQVYSLSSALSLCKQAQAHGRASFLRSDSYDTNVWRYPSEFPANLKGINTALDQVKRDFFFFKIFTFFFNFQILF